MQLLLKSVIETLIIIRHSMVEITRIFAEFFYSFFSLIARYLQVLYFFVITYRSNSERHLTLQNQFTFRQCTRQSFITIINQYNYQVYLLYFLLSFYFVKIFFYITFLVKTTCNVKYYNVIFRKYFQRKIRKREIKYIQKNLSR